MRKIQSPPTAATFGARVAALRKTHGMTQVALCKLAGIKQPSLSDIENDVTTAGDLKASTLAGLAKALKADAEYLLTGVGDPLQFQLVEIYRKLSEDGRDELLGRANRIYAQEHPNNLAPRPLPARSKIAEKV